MEEAGEEEDGPARSRDLAVPCLPVARVRPLRFQLRVGKDCRGCTMVYTSCED